MDFVKSGLLSRLQFGDGRQGVHVHFRLVNVMLGRGKKPVVV
jgi:hypothetical protein